MRLTLRTLLAYLDDTLTPEQTQIIGEKVVESPAAQDLIERIKKVTRRRGLAAPSVTGEADTTDPNTVAEYLDNVLPSDQVEPFERDMVDNDPLLAEVAACHQTLSLVLGEPVKVPPTARMRMYRLVKGRESIPYRKPSVAPVTAQIDESMYEDRYTEDEAMLLGLPAYSRQQPWSKKLIPILAIAILITAVVVCIRLAIPTQQTVVNDRYVLAYVPESKEMKPLSNLEQKKVMPDITSTPSTEGKDKLESATETGPEPRIVEPKVELKKEPLVAPIVNKPDPDRKIIGTLESKDTVLLYRSLMPDGWMPVSQGNPKISSADTLISLPGFKSEIKLDMGVRVLLFGNVPELMDMPLYESKVTLHNPAKDVDADLTLESGRVFLSNMKIPVAPAKVRIRFASEVWDVTLLDDKTEVCIDLYHHYAAGVPFSKAAGAESPVVDFYLNILKGSAGVKYNFKEFPELKAPIQMAWDNKGPGVVEPRPIPEDQLDYWRKTPKTRTASVKEMEAALTDFVKRFSKKDLSTEVELLSSVKGDAETPSRRILAVYGLGAIDSIGYLVDSLNSEQGVVRQAAVAALKHWTALDPSRDLQLYTLLMEKKRYTEEHAEQVCALLHEFAAKDVEDLSAQATLFNFLSHERLTVRELAYWHLRWLDPPGDKELGGLDTNATEDTRRMQIDRWKTSWKKRVVDKKK